MSNWNTITENEEYESWRRGRASNGNGNGNTGNPNVTNGNGNWGGTNGSGGNWGGHHDDRNDLKNSEYNQVAYSGGIILGYSINKRLSLQTGLSYQQNSSKIKDKKIYADKDSSGKLSYLLNCTAGYTNFLPPEGTIPRVRDSITISGTRNFSSYLGIPLIVEYRILSAGIFSLSASAGGRANLLLNGKTKTVLGKGTSSEAMETADTEGLKPAYFSALASITGEMQLNKNLSFTIAPAGQVGLTNVNTKRPIKTRTNYVGLTAGLKLRL